MYTNMHLPSCGVALCMHTCANYTKKTRGSYKQLYIFPLLQRRVLGYNITSIKNNKIEG